MGKERKTKRGKKAVGREGRVGGGRADGGRQDGLGAADTSTRPSQRAAKSRLIQWIDINLITGRRATDRYKYIHGAVNSGAKPMHAVACLWKVASILLSSESSSSISWNRVCLLPIACAF